jgi:hypothetical protein
VNIKDFIKKEREILEGVAPGPRKRYADVDFIAHVRTSHEQALELLEKLHKSFLDIESCFKEDDWSCDKCGKDPEMMTTNAAYALEEIRSLLK